MKYKRVYPLPPARTFVSGPTVCRSFVVLIRKCKIITSQAVITIRYCKKEKGKESRDCSCLSADDFLNLRRDAT